MNKTPDMDSFLSEDGLPLRIREMRSLLGISATALAEQIEVSKDAVSRLERGDAKFLSFQILHRLSRLALKSGISLKWLYANHGSPRVNALTSLSTFSDEDIAREFGVRALRRVAGSLFDERKENA